MVNVPQIVSCGLWFSSAHRVAGLSPRDGWQLDRASRASGHEPESVGRSSLPTQTPGHTLWCLELGSALLGRRGAELLGRG